MEVPLPLLAALWRAEAVAFVAAQGAMIAEIAEILAGEPTWRMSSHAHEHRVDFDDGRSRQAASLHGELAGATVHFEIENGGPSPYLLRATLQFPKPVQDLYRTNAAGLAQARKPFDQALRRVIVLAGGTIDDDD